MLYYLPVDETCLLDCLPFKERSFPYCQPVDGWRIFGFKTFPLVLLQCENQTVSTMIWTQITGVISDDEDDIPTSTYLSFGTTLYYFTM